MAAVRPEFRAGIYLPDPGDPVLGAAPCTVPGCDLPGKEHGLCSAHMLRWYRRGLPDMGEFLADPGPALRGHRPPPACLVADAGMARAPAGRAPGTAASGTRPASPPWPTGHRPSHPRPPGRREIAGCRGVRCGLNPTTASSARHTPRAGAGPVSAIRQSSSPPASEQAEDASTTGSSRRSSRWSSSTRSSADPRADTPRAAVDHPAGDLAGTACGRDVTAGPP